MDDPARLRLDVPTPRRLADLAREFGHLRLVREALDLAERSAAGRIFVACVGQFKRGKSNLLDALVGESLLPIGVVPVTTVPTVVRYGPPGRARVRVGDALWEEVPAASIPAFVSQEHNPDNRLGVAGVEVFSASPLLANGMCLVDTPGLGSVFSANCQATEAFIPHVDAALVVFGADPPRTGAELELVAAVAAQVHDLVLVMNKSDRVTDAERDAAATFSRRMLEHRLGRELGHIHQVSALRAMAPATGPSLDWLALRQTLESLAARSGRALAAAAAERGAVRLARQLLAIVAEEQMALQRPVEDSERRIAALRDTIADAERSADDLGPLFAAAQRQLVRQFSQRRDNFLPGARRQAAAELAAALPMRRQRGGPAFRRAALAAAQEVARAQVMPWLAAERDTAEAAFRQLTQRFRDIAGEFLRRTAAGEGLDRIGLPEPDHGSANPQNLPPFRFYEFLASAQPASPLRWLADATLGALGAHRGIEADAYAFLELLLATNTARVQSDLVERAATSRTRLEAEIKALLREVVAVSDRALQRASQARAASAAAVAERLRQLDAIAAELLEPAEACEPPRRYARSRLGI